MYPQPYEIEEVGNAFISLGTYNYTHDQQRYLNRFLTEYALDFNESEIKKNFKDKLHVCDALKALNDFAVHYQDEREVYEEFKEEIEDLLISVNSNRDEGIMI